jgi:hypothetical protein
MKNKRNKALITVLGGIVSIVVIGALLSLAGFFFLVQKGYFPIPEMRDYLLLYSASIITGLIVFLVHIAIRKRYKRFARGILVSVLFAIGIFVFNTVDMIWYLTPEPFNEEVWKSEPEKPLEMVYSLIRDDSILIGKTRNEAIQILGPDFIGEYTDEDQLTYQIGGYRIAYFQLSFIGSGTVERVYYTYYD